MKITQKMQVQKTFSHNQYVVHSGQFMNTRVHEEKDDLDDDVDDLPTDRPHNGTVEEVSSHRTSTLSIDDTLTKLFQCMKLAYRDHITTPKWKTFKGMHMTGKDKVRLNNLIWREWHMQYIFHMRPVVCQFEEHFADDIHTRPEAVVLEGKYWKRQMDVVSKEYKKWRQFYKDHIMQTIPREFLLECFQETEDNVLLDRVKEVSPMPAARRSHLPQMPVDLSMQEHLDSMDMNLVLDLTDSLFSIHQPFPFPNPKELSQIGQWSTDLIQPGLVQLQPNLPEEPMDLDNLQGLFTTSWTSTLDYPLASFGQVRLQPQCSGQGSQQSAVNLLDPVLFTGGSSMTAGLDMLTDPWSPTHHNTSMLDGEKDMYEEESLAAKVLNSEACVNATTRDWADMANSLHNFITNSRGYSPVTVGKAKARKAPNFYSQAAVTSALPDALGLLHGNTGDMAIHPVLPSQNDAAFLQQTVSSTSVHLGEERNLATLTLDELDMLSGPSLSASVLHSMLAEGPSPVETQLNDKAQQHSMEGQYSSVSTGGAASPSHCAVPGRVGSSPLQLPAKKNSFAVAQLGPAAVPRNSITPAAAPTPKSCCSWSVSPSSSSSSSTMAPSMKNSCLIRLLKDGVYSGGQIKAPKAPNKSQKKTSVPLVPPPPVMPSPRTPSLLQRLLPRPSSSPPPASDLGPDVVQTTPMSGLGHLAAALSSAQSSPNPASVVESTDATRQPPGDTHAEANEIDFPTREMRWLAGSVFGPSSSSLKGDGAMPCKSISDFSDLICPDTDQSASGTEHSLNYLTEAAPSPPPASMSPVHSPRLSLGGLDSDDQSAPSPTFSCEMSPPSVPSVRGQYAKHRKSCHQNSEHRRRANLKTGLDVLQRLVPSLASNPKVSEASKLLKTAEHVRKMKAERAGMQKEMKILKEEKNRLAAAISQVQSQLPETGLPVTSLRVSHMKDMFDAYVQERSRQDWKFWIFSSLMRDLFDSYNNMVSMSSMQELHRTVRLWLEQYCSLTNLRPVMVKGLTGLCISTSILTQPSSIQDSILQTLSQGSETDAAAPHPPHDDLDDFI